MTEYEDRYDSGSECHIHSWQTSKRWAYCPHCVANEDDLKAAKADNALLREAVDAADAWLKIEDHYDRVGANTIYGRDAGTEAREAYRAARAKLEAKT